VKQKNVTTMSLFNPTQESFTWPTSDIHNEEEEEATAQNAIDDTQPESQPEDVEDIPNSSASSDDDSRSESPDRPNRWRGTRHRLESHYANERTLLDSLSALDDDDLSMHLYNVHGLKRGIYPDFSGTNDATKDLHQDWARKERLLETSGEWYPHRSWTQWPLEPAVVPRGDERATWAKKHNGDAEGARKDIARRLELRPSHDLEELLLAEFTKQARVAFEAREWNMENARSDEERLGSEAAYDLNRKRAMQSANPQSSSHHERDPRKRRKLAPTMSPSLTQGKPQNTPREVTLKPVTTGDDEYARSIARPIISSCIDNLDSLLRGLHHSRANHTGTRDVSKRPSPPHESAANIAISDTETEGSSTESQNVRASRKRSRQWPTRSPFPRDWSEVVGMAALVGWDPVIVQRAQERCQKLFAESVVLHNVDKGPYDDVAAGTVDQSALRDGKIMQGGVHIDGFMQPIRRGAKTGTKKVRQKQPRSDRTAASRQVRNPISVDPEQAEVDEEAGQVNTPPTAPIEADEEVEDHVCKDCGTASTPMWRLQADKSWLCNSCHLYFRKHKRHKGNVREEDRRRNREAKSVGPME